ncbi:MAG: hypothetical protein OXH73_21370 [Caldilineaceae bacterium]|nr:hypothetical protein [Caldilineaceae bacterium]
MTEKKECEVDYEEKVKVDASPQEVLESIFAAADNSENCSLLAANSDDSTEGENCPTVNEKKGE